MLGYGAETSESYYTNFEAELSKYDMGKDAILQNVNLCIFVLVLEDGSAGGDHAVLKPNSYLTLLIFTDTLSVLCSCPRIHNFFKDYNATQIKLEN